MDGCNAFINLMYRGQDNEALTNTFLFFLLYLYTQAENITFKFMVNFDCNYFYDGANSHCIRDRILVQTFISKPLPNWLCTFFLYNYENSTFIHNMIFIDTTNSQPDFSFSGFDSLMKIC